jgi:hypothetical protein
MLASTSMSSGEEAPLDTASEISGTDRSPAFTSMMPAIVCSLSAPRSTATTRLRPAACRPISRHVQPAASSIADEAAPIRADYAPSTA